MDSRERFFATVANKSVDKFDWPKPSELIDMDAPNLLVNRSHVQAPAIALNL